MRLSQVGGDKAPVPGTTNLTELSLGATERLAPVPDELLHHGRHQESSYNLLLGGWRLLRSSCLSLHLLASPPSRLKGTHLEISAASCFLDQLREPFLAIVFHIFTSRKGVRQIAFKK